MPVFAKTIGKVTATFKLELKSTLKIFFLIPEETVDSSADDNVFFTFAKVIARVTITLKLEPKYSL